MMPDECCNFDCNQGRKCTRRAPATPSAGGWLVLLAILIAGLILSLLPYTENG